MFGTHCCWTDPLSVIPELNAALQYDINHVGVTCMVGTDFDASTLPRIVHLISAVPIIKDHYTVVRFRVELSDLFLAKLDSLVFSALLTVILMGSGQLSLKVLSFDFYVVTFEEVV